MGIHHEYHGFSYLVSLLLPQQWYRLSKKYRTRADGRRIDNEAEEYAGKGGVKAHRRFLDQVSENARASAG